MKNKAYLVKLSNKAEVPIDGDEVQKLLTGVSRGSMVRVRQGLINPSFIVAVVEDEKRIANFLEYTKYGDEESRKMRREGLTQLDDIFSSVLALNQSYPQTLLTDAMPSHKMDID